MAEVVSKLDSLAIAAIRAAAERMLQATLAGDWDAWFQYLDDDAVMLPPNLEPIETRAKIRAFVEGFPRITENRIDLFDVDGCGDLACARGHYDVKAGDFSDRGKVIDVGAADSGLSYALIMELVGGLMPAIKAARLPIATALREL